MSIADLKTLREGRRAPRFPTSFDAQIDAGARRLPVTITDISAVGAMAAGVDLPARGARVVLLAQQLQVVALIVWRQDQRCGLDFRERIEPLDIVRKNVPHFVQLARRAADAAAARIADRR